MLQHPIPVQRPALPWLVRAPRQGLAALLRRVGNQWSNRHAPNPWGVTPVTGRATSVKV